MQSKKLSLNIIKLIAIIEVLIGIVTIIGLILSFSFHLFPQKPLNVFIFVLISSLISSVIGFNIYLHQDWARKLLIFFSGYVILTKILIQAKLLIFSGEIITFFPQSSKNVISVVYHSILIFILMKPEMKEIFSQKKRMIHEER